MFVSVRANHSSGSTACAIQNPSSSEVVQAASTMEGPPCTVKLSEAVTLARITVGLAIVSLASSTCMKTVTVLKLCLTSEFSTEPVNCTATFP